MWIDVVVWGFWLLYFVVFETVALIDRREGDTLSENVRKWFRTSTKRGAWTFRLVWITFAVWFYFHIPDMPGV